MARRLLDWLWDVASVLAALAVVSALFAATTVTQTAAVLTALIWLAPPLLVAHVMKPTMEAFERRYRPDDVQTASFALALLVAIEVVGGFLWYFVAPVVADHTVSGLRLGGLLPYLALLAVFGTLAYVPWFISTGIPRALRR